MKNQEPSLSASGIFPGVPTTDHDLDIGATSLLAEKLGRLGPFWRDRLFECGLIISMILYYVVGNVNIKGFTFATIDPIYSLPFLFLFGILCWYRLSFALALLPLTLPFYLIQKSIWIIGGKHPLNFSLVEITLGVCVVVALLQLVIKRKACGFWLSWSELRNRLGPFLLPMLVLGLAAFISVVLATNREHAVRAFREEIFDPLIYVLLVLACLRSRQDLTRLVVALLGTALMIAVLGLIQYFFVKNSLKIEEGITDRVHAVYGSANNIGLLFDYTLPFALALIVARVSWKYRLLAALVSVPLLVVLYLSQSRGAWAAIAVAAIFVIAFAIRNRKVLLIGALAGVVALSLAITLFGPQLYNSVIDGHTSSKGNHSSVVKRLYLWQSAWDMIIDHPWLGYGMDNWLCYYSQNDACNVPGLRHYWITEDPVTHQPTGLHDEPFLSHPHNIFLHVWVSIGIFGLLGFVAVLVLFYWLFVRILIHLRSPGIEGTIKGEQLRWVTIGIGAAMLAALVQGQGDSAFLEQDLSFCFWTLVAALLLVRVLAGVSWKR